MNCSGVMSGIREQIPSLFECRPEGEFLAVTTPFTYPDGDQIDVFVVSRRDRKRIALSDLGETTSYLLMHGIDVTTSPRRQALVEEVCAEHGITFNRGQIACVVADMDRFTDRLMAIGQTMVQVLDLLYTGREVHGISFKDDVAEYLSLIEGVAVIRAPRIQRLASIPHRVDLEVRRFGLQWYIKALSSGSRGAANRQVSETVRLWDFVQRKTNLNSQRLLTIIDDTIDVWEPDWLDQMAAHSTVVAWTGERDALPDIIRLPV